MDETLITLTAEIVTAHVSSNTVSMTDLPALITSVHGALASLQNSSEAAPVEQEPAVPIRSSVKPDHITCLDCGKKMKMLKRHLVTNHGTTPEDYKAKWSLPASYPIVAPNYSEQRKVLAVKIGLGRKPVAKDLPKATKRVLKVKT